MRSSLFSLFFMMVTYSLFFSFSLFMMASPQCLSNEQTLLLQLKNNLTFNPHPNNSSKLATWNESVDCCSWRGVECMDGNYVTSLNLSHESIMGGLHNSSVLFGLLFLDHLDLSWNLLDGNVPISLFSYELIDLDLSNNQFSGKFDEFSNISFKVDHLDLSNNKLEGRIPMSIFQFLGPSALSLSSNNFSGSLQLQTGSILDVDLSHNHLSEVNVVSNPSSLGISNINSILLAFNHLKKIPNSLKNLTIFGLDLSNNQIEGKMPNWIWNHPSLEVLDLSHNFLTSLERLFLGPHLIMLDLHSNQLHGQFPTNIVSTSCMEYCMYRMIYLSSNMFHGSIPESICNISTLIALDLSNNFFSGTLPQCLLGLNDTLGVLNLGGNNLKGTMSNVFANNSILQALILNGNQFEGELSKSLANCRQLEVLNIGNNNIKGTFPFYLEKATNLRVLILRSNKFYGPIPHLGGNTSWPILQIVDVALNRFSGRFPKFNFSTWKAMLDEDLEKSSFHYLQYGDNAFDIYGEVRPSTKYQYEVTITSKGIRTAIGKIWTVYTAIDFSCNNFDGPIPEEIGELKLLVILNLSHNAFTGQIPLALGKLSNLESLDLSNNNLSGKIPIQLADGLIFLSVLNLSFNQLEGQVPAIKQFATFENSSFEGNKRLCDFPLSLKCIDEKPGLLPPTSEETHLNSKTMIKWNYISIELGFIFGLGVVIGPVMFWKKWRIRYYSCVDNILIEIFPQLYMGRNYRRKATHNNQRLRS